MRCPARVRLSLLGGLGLGALLFPASASAHGIVGKADLPIPPWLFSWAAAVVLVVSFVALSALWTRPQLQRERRRALFVLPRAVDWLANAVGVGLFAVVVYSGFAGTQVSTANLSVTFVYVVFWVGMPVLSVLFGDVFRAFSPWRTCARVLRAGLDTLGPLRARTAPLRYPRWLGVWPAVAALVGFGWLELVYPIPNRDRPSLLAALSVGYFAVTVAGMALFGVDEWGEQADGFQVYFNVLSRLSALVRDEDGTVCLRRPLSGLTSLPMRRGTVALVCTIIGITTFDGFSNGVYWHDSEPWLQSRFAELGLGQMAALELAYSVGLVFCIGVIAAVYRVGVLGVHTVSARYDVPHLMRDFAHTLAPIGFAYVLAHYFSLLIWQSQAMVYLASDPLGNGANLLGTNGYMIHYGIVSYAAIWYVQVAALLCGHVGGLTLAHDRALSLYRDPQEALRSQYWMLAVMVAFTSFGLWLLSAVGT
ncbi:MAG: fenitrothion hydrolase [Solirubrobacteraceae bacterium]